MRSVLAVFCLLSLGLTAHAESTINLKEDCKLEIYQAGANASDSQWKEVGPAGEKVIAEDGTGMIAHVSLGGGENIFMTLENGADVTSTQVTLAPGRSATLKKYQMDKGTQRNYFLTCVVPL